MNAMRAKQSGFTLAEIIVVIVIIGVLMSLLLPAVLKARERARVAQARVKMNSISLALDAFQRDFGSYPSTVQAFNVVTPGSFHASLLYGDFGYNEAIVQCLCNKFSKGTGDTPLAGNESLRGINRVIGGAPVTTTGPYLEVKATDLADKDGDGFPELVDPWGNAYIFIPKEDYYEVGTNNYRAGAITWTDSDADGVLDPGEPFEHYQRFKFQLISLGPDGWTPGINPERTTHPYVYWDITTNKPAPVNLAPYLVGTDTVLTAPVIDAMHPTGTADDINNW